VLAFRVLGRPPWSAADQAEFERLQRSLKSQWALIATHSKQEQSAVVVPSLSMDLQMGGAQLQAYEERFLSLLLLLRLPRMRVVYVTSQPILPDVIDYYLGLLAGVVPSHARRRLELVTALDGSPRPLSLKLLERPRLLARIRGLIPDRATCHLIAFNTTELETELAVRLGIPLYGADPRFAALGTKSGGRRLFEQAGVPHARGVKDVKSLEQVAAALAGLRREIAELRQAIVKLDDGVSGWGNAVVDLAGAPPPGDAAEPAALRERVTALRFEGEGQTLESYAAALASQGGVVEERLTGEEFRSPSVQMRITPAGAVEVLSTHDQLLGGPMGMSFLGSVFPADPAYAVAITREATKVGERLAKEGVLGRFAIDFVAVRSGGAWDVYAIEVNLRKGGTTAPYLTLEFLTEGRYDAESGRFLARDGKPKFYVASDHVESERYRALAPADVFDIAMRHELHFSAATQTGVVFHMLAALSERGTMGLTAVADSPRDARALFDRTVATLDDETKVILAPL
jgi:hypothetical protein